MVFQGPNKEEMIVSGAVMEGADTADVYRATKNALHANAISAMKRAANIPELILDAPLRQATTAGGLPYWTVGSHSTDGEVSFLQAAVLSDDGALLVTFESPLSDQAVHVFDQFVQAVRSVDGPSKPR
jgi:hypothetical protein